MKQKKNRNRRYILIVSMFKISEVKMKRKQNLYRTKMYILYLEF